MRAEPNDSSVQTVLLRLGQVLEAFAVVAAPFRVPYPHADPMLIRVFLLSTRSERFGLIDVAVRQDALIG